MVNSNGFARFGREGYTVVLLFALRGYLNEGVIMNKFCSNFVVVVFIVTTLNLIVVAPARAQWVVDGTPVAAVTSYGFNTGLQSLPNAEGGIIVVWTDDREMGSDYDIYTQRLDSCGHPLWPAGGVVVCGAAGDQGKPTAATDGAGGVIVTWEDHRGTGNLDIYSQRVGADGSPIWTADGVAVCTTEHVKTNPVIAADGAGGAIVVWEYFIDQYGEDHQLFGQHLDAAGGNLWTSGGKAIVHQPLVGAFEPLIAADGAGGVILACRMQSRYGPDWSVQALRVDGDGFVVWQWDGPGYASAHKLVGDGAGGAIVAWYNSTFGQDTDDVHAQHIDASGNPVWGENNLTICAADGAQRMNDLVSDGEGGAVVCWREGSGSSRTGIYLQSVTAAGAIRWTNDGIALPGYLAGDAGHRFLASDPGYFCTTWHRGDFIFAQKYGPSGVALWSSPGTAVCATNDEREAGPLTTDNDGGLIYAWPDHRASDWWIYAQRVQQDGSYGCGEANDNDTIGLFADTAGAQNWLYQNGAGTFTLYLIIKNPSDSSGISAWECALPVPEGLFLTYASLYGGGTNFANPPNYMVGLSEPLPGTESIVVAELQYFAPYLDSWSFHLTAAYPSSLDPPAPCYVAFGSPAILPLVPSSGSVDEPVFYLNPDSAGVPPDELPTAYALDANFPNPFNPVTTIRYSIPEARRVRLCVYNLQGRLVQTLIDETMPAGVNEVTWQGMDGAGSSVASGVYFYRLTAGDFQQTRSMTLIE
jgi:hypothetical protein